MTIDGTVDGLNWLPAEIDLNRPNAARVYDYYLGGGCNFEVDRAFARKLAEMLPQAPGYARENRAFARRAVRHCVADGVRQFLDLGSGVPTAAPTHEVAARVAEGCRVVYVDNEAVAVAHGRQLLDGRTDTAFVQADMCDPDAVLNAPETRRLLDLGQPIAVLMLALLHFVPDRRDPAGIIARYRDAMPAGSYLVVSHVTADGSLGERTELAAAQYRRTSHRAVLRSRAELVALFDGFDLVPPGAVFTSQWRPEIEENAGDPSDALALAVVARKR